MDAIDFFYLIKPAIPRRFQIALRRLYASHRKKKNSLIWPINPVAAEAPINWPGWHGGKQFALVLIHDVDTAAGLQNSKRLLELERSLGLDSSFNLVPEDYDVPRNLRSSIEDSGFEIGVHGLTHEGRSYGNLRSFSKLVPKINAFLKEWNAVGFTSPSMLSNLRWVADLDIEYSCSSFDTDPFEPRPFGVATIFPFLVTNLSNSRSYIELPYTLPQDHSLFIILREKEITTWKNKLDWVAEHGGLVLVNTHPDYMDFNGDGNISHRYPVRNYTELLEYIIDHYEDRYWNCLPRTLARFWKSSFPNDSKYRYEGTEITAASRAAIHSNRIKYERKIKLALTCAPGGHFEQMQNLSDLYKNYPHFWITKKTVQTEYSLSSEDGHYINLGHFKRPWTYLAQFPKVYRVLKREQPTHMLSTGSGMVVLVPFLLSRLFGIKFIHIETFSHVKNLTKMGRLLLKFHQPILSQWDMIRQKDVISIGPIIADNGSALTEEISQEIVFITLGTRSHQFPRLAEAAEGLIKEGIIKDKVIIQLGSTVFGSPLMRSFAYCSPAEINKFIASSKYVITQESAGIVTKCLKLRKRFIVMPREYRYGELPAKSDMNEDLHQRLSELGFTYVVHNKVELKEAIWKIDNLRTDYAFDNSRAIEYLKKLVENK